ncbi:hypothetical protein EVG20_g6815 [Dentipellis fragilis]|uniref:Six-hairpin glycosidase-like protein n=1 Tax=Dentipellis fragilis TaxID=205917 RepID=A0A4Y9YKG9_9AGAM|nr:hypothetical protein EVG20_g6815 [Dentipellis fragilis]
MPALKLRLLLALSVLIGSIFPHHVSAIIDRRAVVARYAPSRIGTIDFSNLTTPMQVGNGNFAFGADPTGLQTILPFAIMSSWGLKNDSLPPNRTQADVDNYRGVSWLNHGRPVQYDFGGDPLIEQWLISNPNRVNLGRVGLVLLSNNGSAMDISAGDLSNVDQHLDLWTGKLSSAFDLGGKPVLVETFCAQNSDSIGVTVSSPLLKQGQLGIFLDFPWNDGTKKFSAPFVGVFNETANHTTSLSTARFGKNVRAQIAHTMNAATFFTSVGGSAFKITRDSPQAHRYTIRPGATGSKFSLVLSYSPKKPTSIPRNRDVVQSSVGEWEKYWTTTGFVDVATGSTDERAEELQRRIILSRYWMRVNEAGDTPPQESGLVNDGWYGKFHMEMYFWHCAHWALWNNWDLLHRSSSIYSRFLPSSIARAQVQQGWPAGARWPKMTDPTGRSSPGNINNLLIWEQPHPLVFATYERRAVPPGQRAHAVLAKWRSVVKETADWMAAFAWWNASSRVYDIGPPMYVVAEDTSPNITRNPAFELAYWRYGLGLAETWMRELGEDVPSQWTHVRDNLAKLPVENGTYAVYEGIPEDFWTTPAFINDHPALVGLYGWLPETPGLDIATANLTTQKVWTTWNISNCWGWDFPMLAMSAARLGEPEKAIEWLLHPLFQFDDIGMPIGGVRVPTPYFPGSGALLYSIAMMAKGWDGSKGRAPGFPTNGWEVKFEGLAKAL